LSRFRISEEAQSAVEKNVSVGIVVVSRQHDAVDSELVAQGPLRLAAVAFLRYPPR
jgi:hypothetical protein